MAGCFRICCVVECILYGLIVARVGQISFYCRPLPWTNSVVTRFECVGHRLGLANLLGMMALFLEELAIERCAELLTTTAFVAMGKLKGLKVRLQLLIWGSSGSSSSHGQLVTLISALYFAVVMVEGCQHLWQACSMHRQPSYFTGHQRGQFLASISTISRDVFEEREGQRENCLALCAL